MSNQTEDAIFIGNANISDWAVRNPVASSRDKKTSNAHLYGGGRQFALQTPFPDALIDNNASAQARAEAMENLPVVLSEIHIVGGPYSQPDDEVQPLLIKPPKDAVPAMQTIDEWCFETVYDNQEKWKMKKKSREVLEEKFTSIWKEDDEGKYDSSEPVFNARVFTKKVKINVQSNDDMEEFDDRGKMSDIPKGARVGLVVEFRGIRIQEKVALQTPIVTEIYVFAQSAGKTAPAAFASKGKIKFTRSPAIKPASAPDVPGAAAEVPMEYDEADGGAIVPPPPPLEEPEGPGTVTMVNA